jgi:hypothetical protein
MSAYEYSDKYLVFSALNVWANYIETGNPAVSGESLAKAGENAQSKALTPDQMRLILRLRDLSVKIMNGEPING